MTWEKKRQEKKGGFFLVNGFLCSSRDTLEGLLSLSKEGVVAVVVEILWIAFLSPTGMQRNDRQGTRLSSPLLPLFYPGSKGISNLVACSMSPERQKRALSPLHHTEEGDCTPLTCKSKTFCSSRLEISPHFNFK